MTTQSSEHRHSFWIRIRHRVQSRLIAGLLVVVPLWLTYVALKFFFVTLDGFLAPWVERWFGFRFPGFGFVLLFIFIYVIGMVTTNILGRSFVRFGEAILSRIPLVKNIYQGAKQLIHTISLSKTLGFKRVVFIEYPRVGLLAVGFVTNSIVDEKSGKQFTIVFIPTPPNPINGIFEIVPDEDVTETNLTIEEGIKMVISAGMIRPSRLVLGTGGGKLSS